MTFAYVFGVLLLILPFAMFVLLLMMDKVKRFDIYFGVLTENINTKTIMTRIFNVLYLIRRQLFIMIVFLVPDPVLQIYAFIFMCIFQLLYLCEFKPFITSEDRFIETLEELTVLIIACILPDFTDLYDDADMKWNLGWFIIAVIFLNLFVNMIILIKNMVLTVIRAYKIIRKKIIIQYINSKKV